MFKSELAVCDKIDLKIGNSQFYKTFIEGVESSGSILRIAVPSGIKQPIPFSKNQQLLLYYYRSNGKYSVYVRVINFRKYPSGISAMLEVVSDTHKEQRRAYYRLPASLDVEVRHLSVEMMKTMPDAMNKLLLVHNYDRTAAALFDVANREPLVSTRDISASGLLLRARKHYNPGDMLAMKIHLRWPHAWTTPILSVAEIRRTQYHPESKRYFMGLEFFGAFSQRDLIKDFIHNKEIKRQNTYSDYQVTQ
jgi:c-di-GMP-binding flagellar brake protein YcgR